MTHDLVISLFRRWPRHGHGTLWLRLSQAASRGWHGSPSARVYGQPGERGGRADDAIGLVLSEFGARVPEKSIPALTTPLAA
jgi:hypothetical protein